MPAECLVRARALLALALAVLANACDSSLTSVKQSTTIVTTEVTYMPPMMIIGKSDGDIVRCPVATPGNCELFHTGNSSVTGTAVHGEFLFASLASGRVLRCMWQRTHSCLTFHQGDSETVGLAIAAGSLHVGLHNGTILRCELGTAFSCRGFATLNHQMYSLTAIGSVLYAGSDSGRIESCSASTEDSCSLFCEGTSASEITGMANIGDEIYAIRRGGYIQSGFISSRKCDGIPITGYRFTSMAVYNRELYLIRDPGEISIYNPKNSSSKDIITFHTIPSAKSISFSYGTHELQEAYWKESEECIWKGMACPPTVFHYGVQDRQALEVTVRGGRLYDSQGELVDTSDAEQVHKPAIFVMGPDGQILVSHYRKPGLLHTSSLLAGAPVAGAGLVLLHRGRITNITACSLHYRPDRDLNVQVIESLYQKGYTDPIESHDCRYSEMMWCQKNVVGNVV